jgi:hypothetical protein
LGWSKNEVYLGSGIRRSFEGDTNTREDHGDEFRIIDIDAEKERDNHGNMS